MNLVTLPLVYNRMLANRTFLSSATGDDGSIIDGLALDNADMNHFFGELMTLLPPKLAKRLKDGSRSVQANREKKRLCDFKVLSEMVKDMSEAILAYRNISMGEV